MGLEDQELELAPGVKGTPFVLGPDFYWAHEAVSLNVRQQICFCHGCYPNWEAWIDRGRQVTQDDDYFSKAVRMRIDEAKSSSDEDYRRTGKYMEGHLATVLRTPRPICAPVNTSSSS